MDQPSSGFLILLQRLGLIFGMAAFFNSHPFAGPTSLLFIFWPSLRSFNFSALVFAVNLANSCQT